MYAIAGLQIYREPEPLTHHFEKKNDEIDIKQ